MLSRHIFAISLVLGHALLGLAQVEVRCFSCIKNYNCYEGECLGVGCFKVEGRRNLGGVSEEIITSKGCLFPQMGYVYRDECRPGEIMGMSGYLCTCLGTYCNSAPRTNELRMSALICASFVLIATAWRYLAQC